MPSKQELKQELIALFQRDVDAAERAHRASREGATHEEARPENDKDTRALEQSYLARGQAQRVEELSAGLADLKMLPVRSFTESDPVALGALVSVQAEDGTRTYLIASHGGGIALASGQVHVVTPQSPLGRALLGKRVGDDCHVPAAARVREIEVIEVA